MIKQPMNPNQLSALLTMCYHSDSLRTSNSILGYKVDRGSRWYHLHHMGYDRDTDTHNFRMSYSEGVDVDFNSRTYIPSVESEVLRYMYNHFISK